MTRADRARASRLVSEPGDLEGPFTSERLTESDAGRDPVAEAHRRGLAEGKAEGERQALEELGRQAAALREEVGRSLKQLCELEENLNRQHRELMVQLALEAASRIARARIEADDPVAARVLTEAIEALPSGGKLKAWLHPDDLEQVRRELGEKITQEQIVLSADDKLQRGGCIVESEAGTIDATLETAIEAVSAAAEGRPEAP